MASTTEYLVDHPPPALCISRWPGSRFLSLIRLELAEGSISIAPAFEHGGLLFQWDEELIGLRPGLLYRHLRALRPLAWRGLSVGEIRESMVMFGLLRLVLQCRSRGPTGSSRCTIWLIPATHLFADQHERAGDRILLAGPGVRPLDAA